MSTVVTIDNGNSNPHFRIYQENEIPSSVYPLHLLEEKLNSNQKYFFAVSNVGKEINFDLSSRGLVLDFKTFRKDDSFLDMPVSYSKELGDDRLYQAYYLYKNEIKEGERILLADAGTFLTMDIIDQEGFQGGYIFPGEKAFLKTYTKGENLPLVNSIEVKTITKKLPHSTNEAISFSYLIFLKGIYTEIIKSKESTQSIFTGGNGLRQKEFIGQQHHGQAHKFLPHLIHDSLLFLTNHS